MKNFKLILITLFITQSLNGQNMNTEVDTQAKAYIVDSIQINASIEKVFSLIANIKDWPKWFSGVTEVTIKGNAEEGKEFIWKVNGFKIKSTIHTVRPFTDIGWTGKMWWITAIHNWHFESLPDGSTNVIIKESFNGFSSSLMKSSLKRDMRKDLIVLKKESEGNQSGTITEFVN